MCQSESGGGFDLVEKENGHEGCFCGGGGRREGKGVEYGWEREVSGDGMSITPRLSCCYPESKP